MSDTDKYRPPAEERQTSDRTEPVQIEARTEWLYSEDDRCLCCEGRHAFSRGAQVTASPVPSNLAQDNYLRDHIYRAIQLFGDDADLIIEVRRA